MMSHMSRMCSRISSGKPLSGRGIVSVRAARDPRAAIVGLRFLDARAADPLLDLAHAGEILIELRLVGPADLPGKLAGMLLDAVENADRSLAPLVVEQAVERQRRVDFHRHRRKRVLPGDVRAIGHREVALVIARDRLFAAEHQAGLGRLFSKLAGEHLVHADPSLQDGPLLQGRSGEDVACLAGMNADAGGVFVEQARDRR